MQTNAPKFVTWVVGVVIGCLGILGTLVAIPFISTYPFWILAVGFAILALGSVIKGM